MRKAPSQKHKTVKELKFYIGQSRKLARQINRKIESLAQVNRLKDAAKQHLIKICEL